jgi:8-oxo-dGTP pyrophosphatase MutT (NUDIX family)
VQALVVHDVVVSERERAPALDAATSSAVDSEWARALASRPHLVDDWLFSVERVELPAIVGVFVPYRWFVAQCAKPGLHTILRVAPLAVTGRVVTTDRHLVFGLRSVRNVQDPGCWELAPSGGVDPSARTAAGIVDPEVTVRRELEEELGVQDAEVIDAVCVGLAVHPESHVHDLVYDVAITLTAEQLRARSTTRRHAEHDAFEYPEVDAAPGPLEPSLLAAATRAILALPFATMDGA